MRSKAATTPENLLDELQATLAHGTVARRIETLRRVTDLFINGAVDYSDEQVELFRARPLDGEYPYLWLDAKVEKVRERGGVRQKALVIAYAVHESGVREVLGIDVGEAEIQDGEVTRPVGVCSCPGFGHGGCFVHRSRAHRT